MNHDLVEFLRARLDEDEQVAIAIREDRYGDNEGVSWKHWVIDTPDDGSWPNLRALGVDLAHSYADNVITPQRGEHIARWDPARVLAEVEAKRDLIGHIQGLILFIRAGGRASEQWPVTALKLLALPYATHPDYREDWRL